MPAASAKVLPPAPAQKSTTRMPGRASASSAAICEPSSCTSTRPSLNAARPPSGTRSREPQAERRQRGRLGGDALGGERAARRLAVGLQQVDPQIDRRRRVERRHLAFQPLAEDPFEIGLEPFRQIVRDRPRHLGVAQACGRRDRARAVPRPGSARAGRKRSPSQHAAIASGRQPSIRTRAASTRLRGPISTPCLRDPPVERRAVAQHGVDMAGDLRPVLGADIAAAAEVIGRDIVGRPVAGVDRGRGCRSRRRPARRGSRSPLPVQFVTPAQAGVQGRPVAAVDGLASSLAFAGNDERQLNGPAGSSALRG